MIGKGVREGAFSVVCRRGRRVKNDGQIFLVRYKNVFFSLNRRL